MEEKFCNILSHVWRYDGWDLLSSGRKDRYVCEICDIVKYEEQEK